VETLSPSCRACEAGFGEETKAKQVTESDRTLASGHLRIRSFFGLHRTLGEHCLDSGHTDVVVRSEDRTLACVWSWCTGCVRSRNGGSGSSLLCTGH
jgi:hypothetical protein